MYKEIKISDDLKQFVNSNYNKFSYTGCFKLLRILLTSEKRTELETFNRFFSSVSDIEDGEDGYILFNNKKQRMKLGRLLNHLIKLDSFATLSTKITIQIEQIVNTYKSWYDFKNNYNFVEYKGGQILNGYSRSKFFYNVGWSDDSMLWRSCMNDKLDFLDLYANNEDKVTLLVLEDKQRKIHGKALLWNLDNIDNLFLDRVYYYKESILRTFNDFAIENDWLYRTQSIDGFHWLKKDIEYDRNALKMKVHLDVRGIKRFPYMDSMIYLKSNGLISNLPPRFAKSFRLHSTHGHRGLPVIRF